MIYQNRYRCNGETAIGQKRQRPGRHRRAARVSAEPLEPPLTVHLPCAASNSRARSAIVICGTWAVGGQFIDGPTLPLQTDLGEALRLPVSLFAAPAERRFRSYLCFPAADKRAPIASRTTNAHLH